MENTSKDPNEALTSEDHLHIREEYLKLLVLNLFLPGSPPHTWRIHSQSRPWLAQLRITSTYVENTNAIHYADGTVQDHLHIRGEYTGEIAV